MNTTDDAEALVQQMDAVRGRAIHRVEGMVESARTLMDWRHYVASHPWVCLGVAAAAGYLIVPQRPIVVATDGYDGERPAIDAATLKAAAAQSAPRGGLVNALVGMAASAAVRAATQAASQYGPQLLATFVASRAFQDFGASDGHGETQGEQFHKT